MRREFQRLPEAEVLDVLITSRRRSSPEGETYWVFEYELWTPDEESPYTQLLSQHHSTLYPGEHLQVVGRSVYVSPDDKSKLLVIDGTKGEPHFTVEENQRVRLLNPERDRYQNRAYIYSSWMTAEINGRDIGLNVQIRAYGKVAKTELCERFVKVNKIDFNTGGYFLHGRFI